MYKIAYRYGNEVVFYFDAVGNKYVALALLDRQDREKLIIFTFGGIISAGEPRTLSFITSAEELR